MYVNSKICGKGIFRMSNKPWDEAMKRMANRDPKALLQWLLPGAVLISILPLELDLTEFDVDILLKIMWKGVEMLLHVEFQTRNDYNMGNRTVRYNVLAHCEHKLPVLSIVIYLFPEGNIPESPVVWDDAPIENFETLRFNFFSYKVNDMTVSEVLAINNVGLLPLIPLTRDGAKPGPVQDMLSKLDASGDDELLLLGYNFANLVFQRLSSEHPEHLEWLKRSYRYMQERLEESPFMQFVKGEARNEGRIDEARESILEIVEIKYPDASIRQQVSTLVTQIENYEALSSLRQQMLRATTLEDAQAALLAWAKNNSVQSH